MWTPTADSGSSLAATPRGGRPVGPRQRRALVTRRWAQRRAALVRSHFRRSRSQKVDCTPKRRPGQRVLRETAYPKWFTSRRRRTLEAAQPTLVMHPRAHKVRKAYEADLERAEWVTPCGRWYYGAKNFYRLDGMPGQTPACAASARGRAVRRKRGSTRGSRPRPSPSPRRSYEVAPGPAQ